MKEFFLKVWATIYDRVIKNWKTTLSGLLGLILGWLFFDGVISADIVGVIIMILGFVGFVIKDPRKPEV
jgi:membrane-bound ClpP family serine protease